MTSSMSLQYLYNQSQEQNVVSRSRPRYLLACKTTIPPWHTRELFLHVVNRFVELRESNPFNLKQMSCMKKDQNEILGFANVR